MSNLAIDLFAVGVIVVSALIIICAVISTFFDDGKPIEHRGYDEMREYRIRERNLYGHLSHYKKSEAE